MLMAKGCGYGLYRDVKIIHDCRACVPAPVLRYEWKDRAKLPLSSSSDYLACSDLLQPSVHPLQESLILRLYLFLSLRSVAHVYYIVPAFIFADDPLSLGLDLDGIELPGLSPDVVEPSEPYVGHLQPEEVGGIDSAKVEAEHEHVPVLLLELISDREVTQEPQLFHRYVPLLGRGLPYLELAERVLACKVLINGRVEYRLDVPVIYGPGVDGHISGFEPRIEPLKILDVYVFEISFLQQVIEPAEVVQRLLIAAPCRRLALPFHARDEELLELHPVLVQADLAIVLDDLLELGCAVLVYLPCQFKLSDDFLRPLHLCPEEDVEHLCLRMLLDCPYLFIPLLRHHLDVRAEESLAPVVLNSDLDWEWPAARSLVVVKK